MTEINVVSKTQRIHVDPVSRSVSIINAGPVGPGGPVGEVSTAQLNAAVAAINAELALRATTAALTAGLADKASIAYADTKNAFSAVSSKRHFLLSDPNGGGVALAGASSAADPSWSVRADIIVPPVDGALHRFISSSPIYFGFDGTGNLLVQMNATDATVPSLYVLKADLTTAGIIPGKRVQLEAKWDPAADRLYIYWREPTLDLLNDTGWTQLATIAYPGKLSNVVAAFRLGGVSQADEWLGVIFRTTRKVNGVVNADINAEIDLVGVAPDAVTFTASVGGTATVIRGSALGVKLVGSTIDLEGLTTQEALLDLLNSVAAALSQSNRSLVGTGSPEGVVTAPIGTEYTDVLATNGAVTWRKMAGASNIGWAVAYGDTGWRNIRSLYTPATAVPSISGEILIRRVNNRVSYALKQFQHTEAAALAAMFWTFSPASAGIGFRHNQTYLPSQVLRSNGLVTVGHIAIGTSSNMYGVMLPSTWSPSFPVASETTWMTNDPWPSSLPGVAA
jgi:hypothetical protein